MNKQTELAWFFFRWLQDPADYREEESARVSPAHGCCLLRVRVSLSCPVNCLTGALFMVFVI